MEIGWPPASAIDSLVISISMASVGVGIEIRHEDGRDAGKAGGQAGHRMFLHAGRKAAAASGIRIR